MEYVSETTVVAGITMSGIRINSPVT